MSIATQPPRSKSSRPTSEVSSSEDLKNRFQKLLETPIEFVPHSSFDHPEVAETLENYVLPAINSPEVRTSHQYLSRLSEVPLLKKEEEYKLFARMNYLKYRASELIKRTNPKRLSVTRIQQIESLLAESTAVRNHITRANLRLVVSLAKKYADQLCPFEDLLSEGHLPLLRAVELFNFGLGYRFSTYATWAIRNHLIRVLQEEHKKHSRFNTTDTAVLEFPEVVPAASQKEMEIKHEERRQRVTQLLSELPERERIIVSARFGLADYGREQSLSEIGQELGISKERVRQLTLRAIERLTTTTVSKN